MSTAFFIGFLIFPALLWSQSLYLFDGNNQLEAGDTISVEIGLEEYDIEIPVGITNVSGSGIQVNVTRYEEDVLPSTGSYFCWGSCTGVTVSGDFPVYTPSGSVWIGAGATMAADGSGFVLHYDPNFQAGTSVFRLKFFDISNPADSSHMYVSIHSMDMASLPVNLSAVPAAYPNPVTDVLYTDQYTEPFMLCDRAGKVVALPEGKELDVSGIPPGIYFLHSGNRVQRIVKQ